MKKQRRGISRPKSCFCNEPCNPLSQIVASDGFSYLTVCERLENDGTERDRQDKYVVRFKNDVIDDTQVYDKRDLIDTLSVFAQAVSIIQNMEEHEI